MISYVNMISEFDNNNSSINNNKRKYSNSQLQTSIIADSNPLVCSICKSDQIITDAETGEIICSKCGQVILEKVASSSSSEESNDIRSRIGMPPSLARHDMGLSTIIGRTDRDASGQKIDATMRSTMERLRTWDLR